MKFYKITIALCLFSVFSCSEKPKGLDRYDYPNIFDISYTPKKEARCSGWFTDAGSWWGFTTAQKGDPLNGFCGPFNLDMNKRAWYSKAIAQVGFLDGSILKDETFQIDSTMYFPGEISIQSSSKNAKVEQTLIFSDNNTAILTIKADSKDKMAVFGQINKKKTDLNKFPLSIEVDKNNVIVKDENGEGFLLTFDKNTQISLQDKDSITSSYVAKNLPHNTNVIISFFDKQSDIQNALASASEKMNNISDLKKQNHQRWNGYIEKIIRNDMPEQYNRVAVKSLATLISNWKSSRGDLLHDGVVPSHAAWYFMGLWAWDTWKAAVATSMFEPEVSKNQIRAMFDYQLDNGMVIDCVYSDKNENNARDSKPPLAAWAVNEIYKQTGDKEFVKEMFPKLVKYFRWWYIYRDNNKNGICEYGSCDGTLEAAAWESGMDNAIRFDDVKMLSNKDENSQINHEYSMDQESVDLNAFLVYEHKILSELSKIAQLESGDISPAPALNQPYPINVAEYFFCQDEGFFFDKKINADFIEEQGTEACIPLWTEIADTNQAKSAYLIFANPNKFATFVPFPTIAADNPKFTPSGYWRGPIWLDQVYFGINGIRKYGFIDKADEFTKNVFDRLYGLKQSAPIHENYNTHNGSLLKAPHFSWSAAHLLMLYQEYGKTIN